MASMEHIFELEYTNDEDSKKFYQFMRDNANSFFSEVGNVRYKVPALMVKSVINEGREMYQGAKHRHLWLSLNDALEHYNQPNSHYTGLHKAEISRMLIDESRGSYPRLMNLIKKFLDDFDNQGYQFNVVKYQYQNNYISKGRFI